MCSGGWSEAAICVWGKSSRDDDSLWLPLVQHLDDSLHVAQLLWDLWLPENVKHQICLGLPEDARDGRALVAWLAGVHDVGKASPAFAIQVDWLARRMAQHGADVPYALQDRRLAPHALVGQIALEDWLSLQFDAGPRPRKCFASVVGGHHGKPPAPTDLRVVRDRPYLTGNSIWQKVRQEMLDVMAERAGVLPLLPRWTEHGLTLPAQMLASAVVIVADWIASDERRFDYLVDPVDGAGRATRGWAELDLPPPWDATDESDDVDALLADRFPALGGQRARSLQRECLAVGRDVSSPCLMIIEAPMGLGKTEAALLAGEALAARFGLGGLFIGLPSMATSDAMFSRVVDWIDNLPGTAPASTFLAHGKAHFNESYTGLLGHGHLQGVGDEQSNRASAVAASWLNGRKKGVLASMVVGTVDQALFLGLYSKHVVLRHLALSGKVVVIDEVHAADDYMRVYLCAVLEWLAAYGVPVLLLSATLPSTQRRELSAAYLRGLTGTPTTEESDADLGYPAITVVTEQATQTRELPEPGGLGEVSISSIEDDDETLTATLVAFLRDGGCAAVIRNTVGRAQRTYRMLCQHFAADQVTLLHSRFLAPERAGREAALRAALGPAAQDRPGLHIVVGTQVLEQSLDIDFDVMLTDIAPVDSVLQRLGRMHRHPGRARPAPLAAPRLLVTGIAEWHPDRAPDFDAGSCAVYGSAKLLRSCATLGLVDTEPTSINVPADIRPLIERAYAESPPVPEAWRGEAAAFDNVWRREVMAARDRAQSFVLGSVPPLGTDLTEFFKVLYEDDEDRRGGAAVRDGEDSLEVVVVRRVGQTVRSMPGAHAHADVVLPDFHGEPDPRVAKAVSACTVRLPHQMCHPGAIDSTIDALERDGFENWQTSRWLRGALVLVLDDRMRANVAGFELTYDHELGLVVEREGSER